MIWLTSPLTHCVLCGIVFAILSVSRYFFTAGKDEVRAWTIQKGMMAPQAAGKIHKDFEKGFIMAEVGLVSLRGPVCVGCVLRSLQSPTGDEL